MPKSTGSMNSSRDSHWHSLESMTVFFFFLKEVPFFVGITDEGQMIPFRFRMYDSAFMFVPFITARLTDLENEFIPSPTSYGSFEIVMCLLIM